MIHCIRFDGTKKYGTAWEFIGPLPDKTNTCMWEFIGFLPDKSNTCMLAFPFPSPNKNNICIWTFPPRDKANAGSLTGKGE